MKEKILTFFREKLIRDEKSRQYEKEISSFASKNSSDEGIAAFYEIMENDKEYAYEAFFCLATIHRHNKDFLKLRE